MCSENSFDTVNTSLYYVSAMNKRLPLTIDPIKFAEERLFIKGSLSLCDMSRLVDVCKREKLSADASVQMEGGIDRQGLPYLRGIVEADIPLTCQRCLKTMSYRAFSEFTLSPVFNEKQAEKLPFCYEALIVKAGFEIVLSDLVEDELLLVLPLIPKHDETVCPVVLSEQTDESDLVSQSKSLFAKQLARELSKK